MLFFRANHGPGTEPWWEAARVARKPPRIVGELLRGDVSAVCDEPEARNALGWARGLPAWSEDAPAVWIEDPFEVRLARLRDAPPPGVAP